MPTKINKKCAVVKVYKNFRGTRDTIRHLKTFGVISNKMAQSYMKVVSIYYVLLVNHHKFMSDYLHFPITKKT